eukprot:TRINITY_DN1333_c0_g1_i1.p2 TRINITY_DN1333_c0_g1~~TRINITY_DN1333_c0_g1_i1.p2  ORF type:complete len:171 (-),score=45.73 TRINITY_DN1333_c0_g1_i1:58-570(-)
MDWLWGSSPDPNPLTSIESSRVNLDKLAGTWYEISSIKGYFQKGLVNTTSTYTRTPTGYNCKNEGLKSSGEKSGIEATITVPDSKEMAKWHFTVHVMGGLINPTADFWIIEMGENEEYIVVSGPKKKTFWLLSRTPTFDDNLYKEVIERAKQKGLPVENIEVTKQGVAAN